MADFCLVSRRLLDDFEYRIFRFHFLLGADWRLCCRQMGMDRGTFFHAVYDIEQKLGQAFAELEPYPLYPLDEYFGGVIHGCAVDSRPPDPPRSPQGAPRRGSIPLRQAVRQAA